MRPRTGAQILVDQLLIHGVETAYCVPGESYLAVLDALYDTREQIRLVVCRQEGGAAYMADAYGKLTGRPGICFVTRGPGATNASVGVHTAYQDSTPMILFIGQVARPFLERGAFQELDFGRMYGQMAKWVVRIDDPGRIPELLARAFTLATSGRPGPVVIALPEDMLREAAAAVDAAPYKTVQASPGAAEMARLREMLAASERPMMLLGGTTWTAQAVGDITAFAEANRLATASTFRRQDRIDNLHPCYAGDLAIGPSPKLAERVREADLVIAVGSRLSEIVSSSYTLFDVPRPKQNLVHVHMGVEELGRVYQAELPINAGMVQFAVAAKALKPVDSSAWAASTEAAHSEYLEYSLPVSNPGALQLAEIVSSLRDQLPRDTIVSQRRRQLCRLGASLLALSRIRHATGADQRLDGLRRSGRRGRRARASGAHGAVVLGRRLLPDERPGDRDRDPIRRRADLFRGQQRHVRHDPDASGARIPRTGQRHRVDQS